MKKFCLVIIVLTGMSAKDVNAQDGWWVRYGTAYNYSSYNMEATGLQKDLCALTGHDNISLRYSGFGYGNLQFDVGGRHWFVGVNWTFGLSPLYDREDTYYESRSTNTYAVRDNVGVGLEKSLLEGRLGFGHFASEDEEEAFFGLGSYLFAGTANYTIHLNNYTTHSLVHKDVSISPGDVFTDLETRRFMYGIGLTGFLTLGTGPTSVGLGVELRYAHCNSGDWKVNDRSTGLSTGGFHVFSIIFCPQIYHNLDSY